MHSTAATLGLALLALLGAAVVGTTVTASAHQDSSPDDSVDTPGGDTVPTPPPSWQAATTPQLACGVRPAPSRVGGASAATFTCWVAGAPEGDTHFTLEALRFVDEHGGTRPIGIVCGDGTLTNGSGVCTGSLTDPSGAPMVGGLQITGTLLPSGTPLGPVQIAPTLAAS
jgi:hypothetical protein